MVQRDTMSHVPSATCWLHHSCGNMRLDEEHKDANKRQPGAA